METINHNILMKELIFALALICLVSCHAKPRFDSWEQAWMDTYSEGDTLVFKSVNNDLDTTFIERKDVFYQEHVGAVGLYGTIWYRNKNLKYHPEGARLITLIKKESSETSFNINYLYASITVPEFGDQSLNKFIGDSNVYVFSIVREDADKRSPKTLYWHKARGLVEYIAQDSVVWRRIN